MIVVARGGGSLEDLMAFNSEVVCRAVAGAATPVVSAVGHERDVTLCDLVADVRVSTPTAAAAAVVPSREALETRLGDAAAAIGRGLARTSAEARTALGRRERELVRALRAAGSVGADRVERLAPRLAAALGRAAAQAPARLEERSDALRRAVDGHREAAAGRVERAASLLALLSPERTVARGYAIVRDGAGGGGDRLGRGRRSRPGPAHPAARRRGGRAGRGGGRVSEPEATPPVTFEEALRRLDEVVARLESGEVGLEEAVALFEQGQGYLAACRERLGAAQRRIEELTAEGLPASEGAEGAEASEPGPF